MKSILFAGVLAFSTAAWAAPAASATASATAPAAAKQPAAPIKTRDIPVNQFMQNRLPVQIALNIPVPVDYAPAQIKRMGYTYWMRPADAITATAASLPTSGGYMTGSTATNVTYDARHQVFYGIDDPGSVAKMRTVAANVQIRQFKTGKHPAVMVSMISGTTLQPAYFMYMATGVKNEVFFLSLRAPDGRPEVGADIWARLAANVELASK
ncbi:hypothetical protein IP91_02168 [Pseudoduganella lurida]|uniref:Lipoprotein LpqN n=1 Tax=Pseudoduganella lurida TaxID=1036180 RepID=A0A562RBC6_9BURK|nr:hypothetical protein [Pseudoduganella lurida]TWI66355.1 hypothetical protein IP91_02168 [Pseudoduganella lurida]